MCCGGGFADMCGYAWEEQLRKRERKGFREAQAQAMLLYVVLEKFLDYDGSGKSHRDLTGTIIGLAIIFNY
jgi:hypothetical protein